MAERGFWRKAVLVLALQAALVLLVFGVLEALARWNVSRLPPLAVPSGVDHPPYYNNPGVVTSPRTFGYHVKYRINSLGLRGPEVAAEKGAAKRVLLLGDSVVFGALVQDDETLSVQLESRLGAPWQALNGGVGSYEVRDYRGFLERKGLALEPDIVVLGLYRNDHISREQYASHNAAAAKPNRPVLAGLRDLLFRSELVVSGMHFLQRHQEAKRPLFAVEKPLRPDDVEFIDRAFGADRASAEAVKRFLLEYRYDPFQVRDGLPWLLDLASWEKARAPLREIRDLCRARKIPFAVVLFPVQFETYPGYAHDQPGRALKEMFASLDVPVVDLQPVLAATGRGDEFFKLRYDYAHPDREAYALAADELVKRMRAEGWLGRAASP